MAINLNDPGKFFPDQDSVDNDTPTACRVIGINLAGTEVSIVTIEDPPVPYGPEIPKYSWTQNVAVVPVADIGAPAAYSVTPTTVDAELTEAVVTALGNAAQSVLVYQPGGITNQDKSIFATQQEIGSVAGKLSGQTVVKLDDSFQDPILFAAGETYAWGTTDDKVIVEGLCAVNPNTFATQVVIEAGAELQGWCGWGKGLNIEYRANQGGASTESPHRDLTSAEVFEIRNNVQISTSSTGGNVPFFDTSNLAGGFAVVKMDETVQLGSLGAQNPIFDIGATENLIILASANCAILQDAITSSAAGAVNIQSLSTSVFLGPQANMSEASYSGTNTYDPRHKLALIEALAGDVAASVAAGQYVVLRANNAGAVQRVATANLPVGTAVTKGQSIWASCTTDSTGYAELAPNGFQTIESIAGNYKLEPGQTVQLNWDVNDELWRVVSAGQYRPNVHGRDWQPPVHVPAEQETTIVDPAFAVAATLTTEANLFGDFEIKVTFAMGMDAGNSYARAWLANATVPATLDGPRILEPKDRGNRESQSLRAIVALTGTAEAFELRYNSDDSDDAAAVVDVLMTCNRVE